MLVAEAHGSAETVSGGERFLNREISWLDFNRRVLELASDEELPLLERVKLCAIVASNLDDFFAVRMASLERLAALDASRRSPDGRTPCETLVEARGVAVALEIAQGRLWLDQLSPALAAERIRIATVAECGGPTLRSLTRRFRRQIGPLLTTTASGAAFRAVPSLELNVAALVGAANGRRRLVRVAVPRELERFVDMGADGVRVPLENVILHFLPTVVGRGRVEDAVAFRVTRDANLTLERGTADLVAAVEAGLRRRRRGDIVRLEIGLGASHALVGLLKDELGVEGGRSYESAAPLALRDLLELADEDRPELRVSEWEPATFRAFAGGRGPALLTELRRRDVLVHHPYDSFDSSVLAFVSAARDPHVHALKATVYRTGDASPTLASLVQAAESGKEAVAVVEVRARFDERRNIDSGRSLERAGVRVVYGAPDLKVHAKLTVLVRREWDGLRRYVHIGTGNYHASTACSYEDLSLFTADEDISADVDEVFDVLMGRTRQPVFRKLLVGPWFLRGGVLDEIKRVTDAAAAGQTAARIRVKVNSLADPEIIDALYAASQAGASVEIVTRGICALRPGVVGLSDRIVVRSVLGRFLEHSRLLSFQTDAHRTTWIGSADLMPRNLDRRIEVLVPVEDARLQADLEGIFDALLEDTAFSWELDGGGVWHRIQPCGTRAVSAQETFMARAAGMRDSFAA